MAAPNAPRWMTRWLIAAGIYNLVWGAVVIAFPGLIFSFAKMEMPLYPQIWQCVGMIVGVYGIGYLAAARDPLRHWPIVLVGFLGKVFGPLGFASAVVKGELPLAFGATILTNDLIWWVPFAMMLWAAAKQAGSTDDLPPVSLEDAMALEDQHGRSLAELSAEKPTLTVLLRHSGCTFCKEAVADLVRQRSAIEDAGHAIAVITMSSPEANAAFAKSAGLEDLSWISDPNRVAYRAFELRRGTFLELFGPRVWWRGMLATLRGHLVGKLDGDGFQMPGTLVIEHGRVVRSYRHDDAADRADFAAMACEAPADGSPEVAGA